MLEPCCSQARALGSRDSRLDMRRQVRLKTIQSIRLRTLGLSHGCPHARRIRLLDLGDHVLVELWPRLGELLKARRDARLRNGQRSTGKKSYVSNHPAGSGLIAAPPRQAREQLQQAGLFQLLWRSTLRLCAYPLGGEALELFGKCGLKLGSRRLHRLHLGDEGAAARAKGRGARPGDTPSQHNGFSAARTRLVHRGQPPLQ